ncbi:MAG: EamA family transporter [Candidatus Sumerlaeaceae bacterium]|nr:EamA family transporter [Candidatus Sumerlaeaceae bacterium]
MRLGYVFVILAACCWGGSAVAAKALSLGNVAGALLLSQSRVTVAWVIILVYLLARSPARLRVPLSDLAAFAVFGICGIAGANYFLYFAIERMDAAVADVIQFTAPLLVAVWLHATRQERFDKTKSVALALAMAGVVLSLGLPSGVRSLSAAGVVSAAVSALCFACMIVLGKSLSRRHDPIVYLHYGFAASALFWAVIAPPWTLPARIGSWQTAGLLVVFGFTSALLPYVFFLAGLRRAPASRAAIVSTLEPAIIAVGAYLFLGESLTVSQMTGISLVIAAVGVIEAAPIAREAERI